MIADLYPLFERSGKVSTDTRNIVPGSVFFALKGPSFDGNDFAMVALEKGASYAVVDKDLPVNDGRIFRVPDVLQALQHLGAHHRKQLGLPVIAITGTNGKTTTKELIRTVLSKKYKVLATAGNLNNHIGVPLTLLSLTHETEMAVIEMGANHVGEIDALCSIANPDYGLITNVGKAHLEGFGGFEGVRKGKGELYAHLSRNGKSVFINGDNEYLAGMSEGFTFLEKITYGTSVSAYCTGKIAEPAPFLKVEWKCGPRSGVCASKLTGSYNFENILSAVCIGNYFGVKPEDIDSAVAAYQPDNSRSQVISRSTNTIILDAYNANPTSMEVALKNFMNYPGENKVICLGDMAELGKDSEQEHMKIAELVKGIPAEKVILVGPNFKRVLNGLSAEFFEDSAKAAEWIKSQQFRNKTILIKGSRSTKMEKVLEGLS